MRHSTCRAAVLALGIGIGCSEPAPSDETSQAVAQRPPRLVVYAVHEPLRYFAERIGGNHVEVRLPVPVGQDPAFWSPPPSAYVSMQGADLILRNGAGYASWIDRGSLPGRAVVDTSAAFRERLLERERAVVHRHGPAGEHSHGELAFTLWLDPELAILQATAVERSLAELRPDGADTFRSNLDGLVAELRALDRDLARSFGGVEPDALLFSHPVYDYLARRYALEHRALHWEPDALPGDLEWLALDRALVDAPARLMLWEAEPLAETRRRLEERGLRVVVFDPGGAAREHGDYLTTQRANLARLAEAVRELRFR